MAEESKTEAKTETKIVPTPKEQARYRGTKLMYCTCTGSKGAAFQDKLYGKGMRVCNPTTRGFRCTVCGSNK